MILRILPGLILVLLTTPAFAAFDSAQQPDGGPLTIQRVTPDGEDVPASRQITFEFNRPVVALGRMERTGDEIPVAIAPALACHWRWISTRTLSCELDEKQAMQPATVYHLTMNPGLKTLDGATLAAPFNHSFTTQRPRLNYVQFRVWKTPTLPVLRVVWDQSVTKDSVLKHLYILDSAKQRVAVVLSADREKRTLPTWLSVPGEKQAVQTDEDAQTGDADIKQVNGQEARRIWLVEPEHDLPSGQTAELHVEPGLVSAYGPAPSVEDRMVLQFDTFPAFGFVGVRCTNNLGAEVLVKPDEPQKPENFCNPMASVNLQFTTPVLRREVRQHVAFTPSLNGKNPDADPWGDFGEESDAIRFAHKQGRAYGVGLPFGLKAAQDYTLTIDSPHAGLWDRLKNRIRVWLGHPSAGALTDKFGRALPDGLTLHFVTDHRAPNFLLEYQAAVLEKNIDSDVPLYVDNLKKIDWSYNRLTMDGAAKGLTYATTIPPVEDVQFLVPVGARDMLDRRSGAFWGVFASTPGIPETYRNRRIFTEVTPFQVHLKLGHFNSLVWVTDLASGQPVAEADVVLYRDTLPNLNGPQSAETPVRTDANGVAVLPGTETIDPDLTLTRNWMPIENERFFVRVSKGADMALLPLWNQFAIDSYRSSGTSFYPRNEKKFGHIVTWGTTAEGIYHPGDAIQYKIYVRNQDNDELTPPPHSGYWLEIVDPTGKVVHTEKDITLSEFGAASGEFTVGTKAAVGWYNFRLKANLTKSASAIAKKNCNNTANDEEADDDGSDNGPHLACESPAEFTWTPLRVLVSDFTPVPFEVRNQLSGDLFRPGDSVQVTTEAKLHSGGPYTQAAARVTAILTSGNFTSKNPAASGFFFGAEKEYVRPQQVYQTTGPLDDKGAHKAEFKLDEKRIYYGRLAVESAVQDDRGKYVAHQAAADYVGVDRFVGLRLPHWFYKAGEDIDADYIVTDPRGVPVTGVAVTMVLERQERTGAKVKSAGNSYVADTETTTVKESECQGASDATAATCHLKAAHAGSYTLRATVTDAAGRTQETVMALWVSGPGYVMWDDGNDANLDIVADRESYHIGDTAHFLVKNPYPGAKALVTVERYGVLDHFVTTLADSAAVIDLPIKPNYMPGFYLSVNVLSPRVAKPLAAGQVDLGKPAFRMGYVKIPVRDAYKEIAVTASTDRDTYRPGDKVRVKVNAEARHGKNEPVELTVAVLDEAVFDLLAGGSAYYDPYNGFYNLNELDLRNYSLLTALVGRQKFEKKGANPGGDGGSSLSMRSVFKYVTYWNPSLKTDASGNAAFEFTVPDNLTGWRILVLAATPSDRFGLGQADFKVNRPTEVRPEMPNQVSEGDRFEARFSVMNRTRQERTLNVVLKAEGDVDTTTLPGQIEKTVTLKPYERALVALPVKAGKVDEKRDEENGHIRFTATAGDALDKDGMTHTLPVRKLRSLEVGANYGTTLADRIEQPIAFPADIYPDVGAVSVSVAPTVLGNLEGAFRYLRDYPYPCWEQVLTRGVMAAHFKNLRAYITARLTWDGADKLPDQTLAMASDYQAPNGGMAYFIADDAHVDPYLSAYTALAFNWLRHDGYAVPESVETKLHGYLLNFLRHDEAPTFYTVGMSSTVRAVALAALAEDGKADASDVERYAPFVKQMSLFGQAHFAKAAMLVPNEQKLVIDTAKMILAHANETGGKFIFSEELDDSYARMLASPLRENCAVLDMLSSLGETAYGKDLVGDIPFKLVRSVTQTRGGRDHWENTQENMFCMNALIDYSRLYEKDKPDMKVTASLDRKPFGSAQFKDFRDPETTFARPIAEADAGRSAKIELTRSGTGRLYYATRLSYAPRQSKDDGVNAGIEIHREYSMQHGDKWELLTKPYAIHQGDLVRVDLYVALPAARNFVVVDDPIPGGFEPVNTDLANASKVDAAKGAYPAAGGSMWFQYSDWSDYNFSFWSFNHQELRHDSARFYADYLPAGHYHLAYMAQAIGAGDFAIMPTLAAEMYDPDVYGKTGFDQLSVSGNK